MSLNLNLADYFLITKLKLYYIKNSQTLDPTPEGPRRCLGGRSQRQWWRAASWTSAPAEGVKLASPPAPEMPPAPR